MLLTSLQWLPAKASPTQLVVPWPYSQPTTTQLHATNVIPDTTLLEPELADARQTDCGPVTFLPATVSLSLSGLENGSVPNFSFSFSICHVLSPCKNCVLSLNTMQLPEENCFWLRNQQSNREDLKITTRPTVSLQHIFTPGLLKLQDGKVFLRLIIQT